MKKSEKGGGDMVISARRMRQHASPVVLILVALVVLAAAAVLTGCGKSFTEADVVGVYVKKGGEGALVFTTSSTEVNLQGTEGAVTMELKAGGVVKMGGNAAGSPLAWTLKDGRVTVYLFNASASGQFKGDRIVGLGGKGVTWEKQ
jgi:small ligand-binding sensory domain FIST